MTVLDNLLPVMVQYALNNKTGTVNFTNPGLISHNEILAMYKEIVDPDFVWDNFSIEEQNVVLASKRSNNCLNTRILETETDADLYDVKPIKEAVKEILINMKANISSPCV
jgi:3,5-epimerase/4-reductase